MKAFKDLKFNPTHSGISQAIANFDNGYGVSVVFGVFAYSNGIDTYELAVLHNEQITYDTEITDDVCGYLSEEEVTEIMKKVQSLKG